MKFKINYIVIPLIIALVALVGNLITSGGMSWYNTLHRPGSAPQGWFIGAVWTVIFILSMIASLLYWNSKEKKSKILIFLLIINAILNVLWSLLFFSFHLLGWPVAEIIVLNLVNLAIIILFWKKHRVSAILWIPYFLWVGFATYLAYSFLAINK
jgi:tryptophan-rich sensory protein